MTPTQRSLNLLRNRGGLAAVVERWNPHAKIRQDLWGFVDLIHISADEVTLVQTTSGGNVAARMAKIRQNAAYQFLCEHCRHVKVHVHGWRKVGASGKRKTWQCRVEVVE